MVSEQVLREMCPRLTAPLAWVEPLNAAAERFEITTRERLAAFLARLGAAPERLRTPKVAALSAAHFWRSRGLNEFADDRSDDDSDFVRIRAIINGGRQGLAERRRYWERAKAALR